MLRRSFARAEPSPAWNFQRRGNFPRRFHSARRANRSLRLINHDAARSALVRERNEAVMRCLLAAVGLIGLLPSAFAADYSPPALRGSRPSSLLGANGWGREATSPTLK